MKRDYIDAIVDYHEFIRRAVGGVEQPVILDTCCGAQSEALAQLNFLPRKIGLDRDFNDLQKNHTLEAKVCGDVSRLPFPDNSFTLVCMHWGLEHLSDPAAVFKELYRILTPRGMFVAMTTNVWCPFYFLAKVTPLSFHAFIRKKLLKTGELAAHPTHYRANSPLAVRRLLTANGFTGITVRLRTNPYAFSFSNLALRLGFLYDRITDNSLLGLLRMFMVVAAAKPSSGCEIGKEL
jgi:ubiquinone/menaquinone biosynthesis C-methylase UbiE